LFWFVFVFAIPLLGIFSKADLLLGRFFNKQSCLTYWVKNKEVLTENIKIEDFKFCVGIRNIFEQITTFKQ
jgi:hypothetical protein